MSEREKEIIETIAKALPKMSEFDKGYFWGVAESSVAKQENKRVCDKSCGNLLFV